MNKKPIYAGYINLRPINGIIFPSYAQNQIYKDYIVNKLNGDFFMSANENTYGKNNIVLRSLLNERTLKGVCLLSIYSLPNDRNHRKKIYKILFNNKKQLHFIFEEKTLQKKKDVDLIEELFIFNNPFFTLKKNNLTNFERQFVSKDWSFI